MSRHMAERTTVRLADDLLRRAKRKAAAEGKANRVLPPVSRATPGLVAGIDLDETAALQEMEDLDYARRRL